MTSKFDWSQYETVNSPESNSDQGFDWNQFESVKQPSRARSLISAPVKGAAKSVIEGAEALRSLTSVPIPGTDISIPMFGGAPPGVTKRSKEFIEENLPTQQKTPEELLERAGSILPYAIGGPGGLLAKGLQVGGGALAGQIAKANELGPTGQAIAEIAGMALPGLAKVGGQKAASLFKATPEKMASGLTKPRAVEAKRPELGAITTQRQEQVIKNLNEEATKLTQESVKKHVPLAKQIQEGFDFESKFEKGFGDLKKAAEKYNPEIDITPVSEYLSKNARKYTGIPKLHPEAQKVVKEIRALRDRPQTNLRNLMKIYRSNNQKIKSVYESSLVSGKQKEYVDFLTGLNREIASSFRSTLPKDSAWVKQFDALNHDFRNFRAAQETLNKLRPILQGEITPAKVQKIAVDPKTQRKLAVSMGEHGAKEVVQIAKDLRTATEAIKKIPKKELQIWDGVFPLGFFIPFAKFLGIPAALLKGIKIGKYGYGYLLSTPARRAAYQSALKAVSNNDLQGYKNAVAILLKELKKDESNQDRR